MTFENKLPHKTAKNAENCSLLCNRFKNYKASYETLLNTLCEANFNRNDIIESIKIWKNAQINNPALNSDDEIIEKFNRNLQENLENLDETIIGLQNKINECDSMIGFCEAKIKEHAKKCKKAREEN